MMESAIGADCIMGLGPESLADASNKHLTVELTVGPRWEIQMKNEPRYSARLESLDTLEE